MEVIKNATLIYVESIHPDTGVELFTIAVPGCHVFSSEEYENWYHEVLKTTSKMVNRYFHSFRLYQKFFIDGKECRTDWGEFSYYELQEGHRWIE